MKLISELIGRHCIHLSADPETEQWHFEFGDQFVLQVSCPWRIVVSDKVCLGWADDGHRFGRQEAKILAVSAAALLTAPIDLARISDGTGDLTLRFGVACRLEVFNASAGYEGWILNAPGGKYVVAQGGGNVVEESRPDV